jgi:hypothetical protein
MKLLQKLDGLKGNTNNARTWECGQINGFFDREARNED